MNGYDLGPGPYPAPARNPAGPTLLLALALGCAILFAVLWHRSHPGGGGPLRRPAPGEQAAPGGSGRLTVEFLDVGQGDSTLIRSPEGKLALVDAGPSGRVVATLRRLGVDRLDLAVVSHHHADHYGGMLEVIRAFRPRVFLDAPSPHASGHNEGAPPRRPRRRDHRHRADRLRADDRARLGPPHALPPAAGRPARGEQ